MIQHAVGGVKIGKGKAPAPHAKHVKRVSVERGANGGYNVTHDFHQEPGSGSYVEPETHTFGPDDHGKVMGHLKKHLGLKSGAKKVAEMAGA